MGCKALITFVLFSGLGSLIFVNCSSPKTDGAVESVTNTDPGLILVKLSETPYEIDSGKYNVQNFRLMTASGPIYFQFVAACPTTCPAVVVSLPYTGISWTGDPMDLDWAAKDPTGQGILTADINGPNYLPGSGDVIAYYHSSIPDAVGFGGVFLNSGVSAVVVYNRFYLGRKLKDYAQDYTEVLNHLADLKLIDTSRVASIGASLGGFVSLHASRKSVIKPKVIVGVTPLIDLESEFDFMSTESTRITANPSLLAFAENFFRSYLRRMSVAPLSDFTYSKLAVENKTSQILVIHDTWDAVVPIAQWQNLSAARPVDSFIFQHASPINFNTFKIDHGQPSEGYSNKAVMPIYMSYILSRLTDPDADKNIYYYYNDFLTTLIQVKEAKDRGQKIGWIKTLMTDLCTPNTIMKDISATFSQISGAQFVGGVLLNVWKAPTTIDGGCDYLLAHPDFFN